MFKPREDYILIKPLERIASSVIVAVLHEMPNLGIVMAVGPGKRGKSGIRKPLDVQVGDTVRYGEFKNMFPEWRENPEDAPMLIMQEADVAGIVDDVPCETFTSSELALKQDDFEKGGALEFNPAGWKPITPENQDEVFASCSSGVILNDEQNQLIADNRA